MIILCIFNINYILLEISGSHSNIISDSYVFHYGNELISRTGNKEICHFVTANYDQKYPFAVLAALLHGTVAVGISQTWRRWTEGATYIRQGIGPHSSLKCNCDKNICIMRFVCTAIKLSRKSKFSMVFARVIHNSQTSFEFLCVLINRWWLHL